MDDDDDFGDAEFLSALAASEAAKSIQPAPQRIQQPAPQRVVQPQPQIAANSTTTAPKVVQPTPQALPSRSSGSSILVSPKQKGNPILANIRSLPWEYSDILPDYVLGLTTCALFLSLKYHRLHPEYIYNRIRLLAGKYNLRILLTMVDIQNHEDPLKELSKTSLLHSVTVILCWSAQEAARYLELYKSLEHANPGAIRERQATTYAEKMAEFVTVPRSINKTDAVSLVSAFGTIRAAVNARPEEIAVVGGWGEKKVRKWCAIVNEPFRAPKAAKRTARETEMDSAVRPLAAVPLREMGRLVAGGPSGGEGSGGDARNVEGNETRSLKRKSPGNDTPMLDLDEDDLDEEAMREAAMAEDARLAQERRRERARKDEELSDGMKAALAKLRAGPAAPAMDES